MIYQEEDAEFYNERLAVDEPLAFFIKASKWIVMRVKGTESPYVQVPQSSEEKSVRTMVFSVHD